MLKLGKKPARFTRRSMRSALMMARALDPLGPPPAASNDYTAAVTVPWQVFGNDSLGDCLIEGTVIDATDIQAAYRAPYHGPVVRLTCASGKVLTVTPNHAILTPIGFVCAKDLQKGDDLVGASRPQIFPSSTGQRSQRYFNHSPAPVEQIFSAFSLRRNLVRKVMPIAVHFHGDGKFVNGDIDIVSADSFLRREPDTALGEPHRQRQIRTTSELERHFHRAGTALQRFFRSFLAAFRDMSVCNNGPPFGYAHAGVSQAKGLSLSPRGMACGDHCVVKPASWDSEFVGNGLHRFTSDVSSNRIGKIAEIRSVSSPARSLRVSQRSRLQASRLHPSRECAPTDAELCGSLLHAIPSLVEFDRLINVELNEFKGHIFDVSTELRWYSANGIITHNCVCADTAHTLMLRTANAGTIVVPTDDDVLKLYEAVGGYKPGDSSTDQGCVEAEMCEYLERSGFLGHKADAVGAVDPQNLDHLRWTIQLFGSCRIGVELPQSAMDQFDAGKPWDVSGDGKILGGHDVPLVKYAGDTFYCVTWGRLQPVMPDFILKYSDEAHIELFADWMRQQGTAPSGFDLADLAGKLAELS
jgi:intein/homing endonuclease